MSRTHVITGAASGIGLATAELLRSQGQRAVGVDLHDAEVVVDLASPEGRAALPRLVADATDGQVDAVVACAGTVGQLGVDLSVNYFGAVATLEGLRPLLAAGDQPRAVAVASFAVLQDLDDDLVDACLRGDEVAALERAPSFESDPGRVYASSKRALARWVRRAAPTSDWAGADIALNAVAPGVVRTPMTAPILDEPAWAEALLAMVPMPLGGLIEPEAIAALVAFLTGPSLRSVTGQTIFADGGGDCVVRGDDVWSVPPS